MRWGVETIVNEAARTVDLKVRQVGENEKDVHTPEYDLTSWNTFEEAEANRKQVREAWQGNAAYPYTVRG